MYSSKPKRKSAKGRKAPNDLDKQFPGDAVSFPVIGNRYRVRTMEERRHDDLIIRIRVKLTNGKRLPESSRVDAVPPSISQPEPE